MSDRLEEIDIDDNEYYEREFEDRAAEFNLQDINESYLGLNNINLLLGGLNSNVVESLKQYKGPLKEHFGTQWASKIVDLYGEKGVDSNTIRLALEDTELSPQNIEVVAQHYEKTHNQLGEKSLAYIKTRFQQILNAAKMNWFVNNITDPEKIVEGISKKGVIKIGDGLDELRSLIKEDSIFNVNPEEIKNLSKSGIKSSLEWINNCFSTGGYPKGSFVLVSMPPGVGKSLYVQRESLSFLEQGYHVVYTCIGDLGPQDILIRFIAMYYNVKMNHVVENIELYMKRFEHDFGEKLKNFHPLFIEPGTVTMSQLAEYYKKKGYQNGNTICIVDYDENLASEKGTVKSGGEEMMFEKFKAIYQKAISLTRGEDAFAALFILGQPKTEAYSSPKISMIQSSMGSSSKSHNMDLIITAGREQCVNHQGYLSIVKCRRHGRVAQTPYTLTYSGRFEPISQMTYDSLKTDTVASSRIEEDENNRRIVEETKKMLLNGFKEQEDFSF